MNDLLDLFIIALAGLVHATLQLGISALLLLYHASLGKNVKRKTRELVRDFNLGISLFIALLLASTCFVTLVIFGGALPKSALVILVGLIAAMAFGIWFLYYRKSTGTELWVPRSFARFITERADKTDDGVEAFSLGMLIACAEVPFAMLLIITAANSVLNLPQPVQLLAIAVYVLIATMPMWLAQLLINNGKTIVDIQRWRVKNKQFLKVISGVGFITLAIFLLAFKVMTDF
ncbi:hypothetical protein IJH74_01560 [Candidatus Saccharibacteria bacterium]|nr:hypothetical protein [Candidatus Saccharibacteria bacterium]